MISQNGYSHNLSLFAVVLGSVKCIVAAAGPLSEVALSIIALSSGGVYTVLSCAPASPYQRIAIIVQL